MDVTNNYTNTATIEPFKIDWIRLNDRFKTIIGFEFLFTGIEPRLYVEKLDRLFMLIESENTNSHSTCMETPLLDCYLQKNWGVDVTTTEVEGADFVFYKFRVTEVYNNGKYFGCSSVFRYGEDEEGCSYKYSFRKDHPDYVVKYLFDLINKISLITRP